jgi:uncharacterized membrane protein YbhN (UPF0104 family)
MTPETGVGKPWSRLLLLAVVAAAVYAGSQAAFVIRPGMGWAAALVWSAGGALLAAALIRSSWPMRVGLAVSLLCLAYFMRDVDLAEMGKAFGEIRVVWLVYALVMGCVFFGVKTYRWQILLRPVQPLGFWRLFRATVIGFMGNTIFPARAGELIRAGALAVRGDVRVSAVFATIVVERLFDLFCVVALLVVAIAWLAARAGARMPAGVLLWGYVFAACVVAGGVFLALLRRYPRPVIRFSDALARSALRVAFGVIAVFLLPLPAASRCRARAFVDRLSDGIDARLLHVLEGFSEGLQVLRGFRQTLWITVLSLVHWWMCVYIMYLVGNCFEPMMTAAGGRQLNSLDFSLVFVFAAFAVALPSSPGYIGPFQVAVHEACKLLGAPVKYSTSYAWVLWFANNLPVVALGMAALWLEGISLSDIRRQGEAAARAESDELDHRLAEDMRRDDPLRR